MEPISVVLVFHAWDTDACRLLHRSVENWNVGYGRGEVERRMLDGRD
jgi:hypothetical protein